ncbi:MAG: UDP-N-acetylmuramoyl-L-alanyl-D-glutamate--2,6-diaminopimelate ligase [Firmicutes bacterium]|nr:UDP-N-acetylmuramoyl-L-alanyl-D-glutamate--2,6-diaminopimelate ligase [Bacillota bacterium]
MKLADLLRGQPCVLRAGSPDVDILGLAHDSRQVAPGAAFFCLPGQRHDGHDFAAEAVGRGAAAVVGERPLPSLPPDVTQVLVPDARLALALAAAAFWGRPGDRLRLVAVTGTNGKTTVNHLIQAALEADGRRAGLVGTVESRVGPVTRPAGLTTPDAIHLQETLAAMVRAGLEYACLEVSSHGLAGRRLAGCEVDVAVLTNVTRDHLDFHRSLREYVETKLSLFRSLGRRGPAPAAAPPARTPAPATPGRGPKSGPVYAVLNADDDWFDLFRGSLEVPYLAYGARGPAHVRLTRAAMGPTGSLVRVAFRSSPDGLEAADWLTPAPGWPEEAALFFPHPGPHNASNLLAGLAVAWAEGVRWEAALRAAETFPGVRGRWEVVPGPDGVVGVVDFAHNPAGLLETLRTARLATAGRVILVFGCEGQKDRGKRPLMGAVAAALADHVILTTDNTFHEDRRRILADVAAGLADPAAALTAWAGPSPPAGLGVRRATFEVVEDRAEAIHHAVSLAERGDLVLVAGRGHDTRLVFGSRVEILDDHEVLAEALRRTAAAYSHSMVAGGLEVTS